MARFAFVVHPITARDAAKKYPIARFFPDSAIEAFLRRKKPVIMSQVTGIKSITGAETTGVFIGCPLTPTMMTQDLPLELVYDRIVECTEMAKREGAELIGLGAFTSVVGDGGITVASRSPIAVTTGNSYTVATAIEGAFSAAAQVGVDTSRAVLAVVGATGSIGKTCARIMSPSFSKTLVIGRDLERTEALAREITRGTATTDFQALREADVVVTVTSAETAVVEPEHLRQGAIVCDVSRPRDVSVRVVKERPDVLVIEGGVVSVPGDVEFGMTFGFPQKTAYACMSETMILALENKIANFTLGKEVSVAQVEEINQLATKHGFKVAGFRSFERAVEPSAIERTRHARAQLGFN